MVESIRLLQAGKIVRTDNILFPLGVGKEYATWGGRPLLVELRGERELELLAFETRATFLELGGRSLHQVSI